MFQVFENIYTEIGIAYEYSSSLLFLNVWNCYNVTGYYKLIILCGPIHGLTLKYLTLILNGLKIR